MRPWTLSTGQSPGVAVSGAGACGLQSTPSRTVPASSEAPHHCSEKQWWGASHSSCSGGQSGSRNRPLYGRRTHSCPRALLTTSERHPHGLTRTVLLDVLQHSSSQAHFVGEALSEQVPDHHRLQIGHPIVQHGAGGTVGRPPARPRRRRWPTWSDGWGMTARIPRRRGWLRIARDGLRPGSRSSGRTAQPS